MPKTNVYGKTTRPNRAPVRSQEGNGHAHAVPGADAPALHCPSCGMAVADAANVMEEHQQFLKKLFERHEELQRSLASSIHDELAQQLTGALLYLEGSPQTQGGLADSARENFCTGLKLLRDSIHEARQIAGRLQPLIDHDGEVGLAIEYLIHDVRSRGGPEIVFQAQGEIGPLTPELGSAVFRIVRELLANACRHSGSRKVRLEVARSKDRLRIEVQDQGHGFDPENVDGKAFGLQEIQQRAKLLGGEVAIDSAPGKGTRVMVTIPIR